MEFKNGAKVLAADGEQIGRLNRLVINPRSNEVTHIVVEKGWLFPKDKVLPIDWVEKTEEKRVLLRDDVEDLKNLPDFETTHYVAVNEDEGIKDLSAFPDKVLPDVYWYPPLRTYWWKPGEYLGFRSYFGYPKPPYIDEPSIHARPQPEAQVRERSGVKRVTEQQVPDGTVAIKEGAKVFDEAGEHVGDISRVLTVPDEPCVTHIVVSKGILFKEEKLVPTTWIADVEEDEVRLAVSGELVNERARKESA
jgi:uncharacterized protein YrrD